MSLPDHLDFGPETRPRRRTPDALYYGSDCFARDPEKWLKRNKRKRAKNRAGKNRGQIMGDAAARRHKGWIDFHCHVCGDDCMVAPDLPDKPVCHKHCEDHEYEYDRGLCLHVCMHCGLERDPDYGLD